MADACRSNTTPNRSGSIPDCAISVASGGSVLICIPGLHHLLTDDDCLVLGGAEFRTGRVSAGQTGQMLVLVWITPRSWVSCVEAAQSLSPEATITLAAVVDTGPAGAAHGAYGGGVGP